MRAKLRIPPKLEFPRLHRAVARPRVFGELDRTGEYARVTAVIGPPGAGKSTVVSTWLRTASRPSIWYQLDPNDADLPTFFLYLTVAAAGFRRRNQRPLPMLSPEYQSDIAGFARRYFRTLFARLPEGAVMVFDNYQDVPVDAALHNLLSEATGEVPQGIHWVFISRNELPACYARHEANEAIGRLDWGVLRLDRDEVREIASSRTTPSAMEVQRLTDLSDGWPAGLTLLLESSTDHRRGAIVEIPASRQKIFDYFAAEVFDKLPETARKVLIAASLLPWVDTSVVAAITGIAVSASILADLHSRRLFIDRRGEGQSQYQFHPLFHEFLRRRADLAMDQGEREHSLRAAATHLMRTGQQAELALALLLEVGEWSASAELISNLAPTLLGQGRWRTLVEWIARIERQSVVVPTWIRYWHGMAMMNVDLVESRAKLVQSAEEFAQQQNTVGELLASAAIIRTYHYAYNTFEPVDEWVDRISKLIAFGPTFPDSGSELAVYSALVIAVTFRQPNHPLKNLAQRKVRTLLDSPLDPNQRVSGAVALVQFCSVAQEFDSGAEIVRLISPIAESLETTALNRMFWWMAVGYSHHRKGNHTLADQAFQYTDRVARDSGLDLKFGITRCMSGFHMASWADVAGVFHALAGVEEQLSAARPMLLAQYHLARLMAEMLRGEFGAAESHARKAVMAASRLGAPFFRVAWLAIASAPLAINGHHAEAEVWLAEAWQESEGGFLTVYRPTILATRAYCRLVRGDRAGCRDILQQLLNSNATNEDLSYIRTFPLVKDAILREALHARIAVAKVKNLIRLWELAAPSDDVPDWPWPVRIYTLGRFCIEVDGREIEFGRKVPRKPIMLLKAIVAYGGRDVSLRRLADAIWPDEDGDAALSACTVALHRLRRLLERSDAIVSGEGSVTLDPGICWVDAWALFRRMEQSCPDVDEIVGLYRGQFLESDLDATWAVSPRQKLRLAVRRRLTDLAREQETTGNLSDAITIYRKAQNVDSATEELYLGEMRCLHRLGRTADALGVFNNLRSVLKAEFGTGPSFEIERYAERIKNDIRRTDARSDSRLG